MQEILNIEHQITSALDYLEQQIRKIASLNISPMSKEEGCGAIDEKPKETIGWVEGEKIALGAEIERLKELLCKRELEAQNMRDTLRILREQVEEISTTYGKAPHSEQIVDQALRTEILILRAERQGEKEVLDSIISALEPLIVRETSEKANYHV